MKLNELIQQFPWTNHPLVRTFAESFSEGQWHDLDFGGVGELINSNRIGDTDLLKMLKGIHEVANYPENIKSFKSGERSFLELVTYQIEMISKSKSLESTEPTLGSEIQYLLANGLERTVLDGLFDALKQDTAVFHVVITAKVLAQYKPGLYEKGELLQKCWEDLIYPADLLCTLKKLPSECMSYLANELTYEQFKSTSNSNVSALFKSNPSTAEFEKFKKETLALSSFFNCCLKLVEAAELTDEADNGLKLVI